MSNPFLVYAYLAGILSSIAGGIVGSYVVAKRIVFIAGSIAHSVLGGMGLCLYLQRTFNLPWLEPIYGAILFALIAAYLIGMIHLKTHGREDSIIASIWVSGMSIGVIFLALTPGYSSEILHFLFGNILWTNSTDLITLCVLDAVVLIAFILCNQRFLAICFDETQSRLQSLKNQLHYFILLSLIALTVVLLIQVVGTILVIAILSLPPAIANTMTKKLNQMIWLAVIFSLIFTTGGTWIASFLNWPPGATISILATFFYFLSTQCSKTIKI